MTVAPLFVFVVVVFVVVFTPLLSLPQVNFLQQTCQTSKTADCGLTAAFRQQRQASAPAKSPPPRVGEGKKEDQA